MLLRLKATIALLLHKLVLTSTYSLMIFLLTNFLFLCVHHAFFWIWVRVCGTVTICQNFCSVFGGNLIKHVFSSKSKEGITIFIMPASCFSSVFPLNFLQLITWGEVIGWWHYQNQAYTWLSPHAPLFW